jgi:hypothetical protein
VGCSWSSAVCCCSSWSSSDKRYQQTQKGSKDNGPSAPRLQGCIISIEAFSGTSLHSECSPQSNCIHFTPQVQEALGRNRAPASVVVSRPLPGSARANRAGPGGQRAIISQIRSSHICDDDGWLVRWQAYCDGDGDYRGGCSQASSLAVALSSAYASFAPTHDLIFSAIPTGLRFPVSIRASNCVSSCSQPALTLSFSRFVHLLGQPAKYAACYFNLMEQP